MSRRRRWSATIRARLESVVLMTRPIPSPCVLPSVGATSDSARSTAAESARDEDAEATCDETSDQRDADVENPLRDLTVRQQCSALVIERRVRREPAHETRGQ